MQHTRVPGKAERENSILYTAVGRVLTALDLEPGDVAGLAGIETYRLNPPPSSTEGAALAESGRHNALRLIRIFRALVAATGSEAGAKRWLRSHNTALGDQPMALLRTDEGLGNVLAYLEAEGG